MSFLLWIIFGALAGWIASMLTGEDARMGAFANIGVGILGAILGGWIFSLLGGPHVNGFNLMSLVVAVSGSVVLILVVRTIFNSRKNLV
jgi:uncharacterized membrane protein YeaQ/YmgE (transglycosylase-associated protein family)